MKKAKLFINILTIMLLTPIMACEIYLLAKMIYNLSTIGQASPDGMLVLYQLFFYIISVAFATMLMLILLLMIMRVKKVRPFLISIIIQIIHLTLFIIFIVIV